MTKKDKRKAVHNYQLVVYTPQEPRFIKTSPLVLEIAGHEYPYREKKWDLKWLSAFLSRKDQVWYWHPTITYEDCHPRKKD